MDAAFGNAQVKLIFDSYPQKIRDKLLFLRTLIFKIAEESEEVGVIDEMVKWDSPSYLTQKPKSGTTIRLSRIKQSDTKFAISVHCQTSLIGEFKLVYPDLKYDGNRSVIFDVNAKLPIAAIEHFVYLALTYHARKKSTSS